MLDGLLPIVVGIMTIAFLIGGTKQLWKGFKASKFIPWLLCFGFMLYCAIDMTVPVSLGKSVWKVASNLITHVNVPPAKQ
jgi:hypothetical protein